MNDSLLRAQLHQREASLASAKAVLAQASADLKRAEELNAQGYLAQASLDQRQAAQQTAAANLSLAQAALNEMSVRLAQASLRAPVAGLIAERHVVAGQIIEPSRTLFRIVRDGRLELNAQVPEANLSVVRAGQKAVVSSNALGSTPGHVRLVTPQVDPQTRVGLVHVALDRRGQFRPGMFGKTVIDTANAPALLIPQASVLYRDNKPGVFVIDAKRVAHFRGISTGTRSGDDVEVLSGLAAGDAVALQGAGFLAEGDQVRIVNASVGAR
jgi:RND family efflux transporter MFP subunit